MPSFLAHIRATRLEVRADDVDGIDLEALTPRPALAPKAIGTQGDIDLRRMAAGGSRQSAGH